MISRRDILAAGLGVFAAPAFGQTRPKPRPAQQIGGVEQICAELIAAARLGGAVGYAVGDIQTGKVLGGGQASVALPPASVTKAVTTLYALHHLGAGHRFETKIMATGPVQGGLVQGDLILAGGGDPSFDTDRLGDLVAALAQAGVRGISGRFLVWGGALPFLPRITDDQPDYVGYNPSISGIMLNFNRAQFVWGAQDGKMALAVNAEGARFNPPVGVIAVRAAARQSPLFAYDGPEAWSVAEAALRDEGSRWLPVRAPSAYAGDVMRALAKAHGVTLPAATEIAVLPSGAQVLVQDQSAPLSDVLRGMLRFSTNITAEAVGLAASRAENLAGSAQAMTAWAQAAFGMKAQFVDHSGLGIASLCTPQDMLAVMQGAAKGGALQPLLRERRINRDGRDDERGDIRIFAKSGTLNFVSNLAGMVRTPSGRMLAFAIFAADTPRRAALPMDQREDPAGGGAWSRRARNMQKQMIAAWAQEWN
jgi:serine-type D-Ala-D-Ala carboxypeptidase/endopeptidase (penicillin-binding protein 4)